MHKIFFFNDTATTEIYTLSLHDALPIWPQRGEKRIKGSLKQSKGDMLDAGTKECSSYDDTCIHETTRTFVAWQLTVWEFWERAEQVHCICTVWCKKWFQYRLAKNIYKNYSCTSSNLITKPTKPEIISSTVLNGDKKNDISYYIVNTLYIHK